jgi:hypothetical protein
MNITEESYEGDFLWFIFEINVDLHSDCEERQLTKSGNTGPVPCILLLIVTVKLRNGNFTNCSRRQIININSRLIIVLTTQNSSRNKYVL